MSVRRVQLKRGGNEKFGLGMVGVDVKSSANAKSQIYRVGLASRHRDRRYGRHGDGRRLSSRNALVSRITERRLLRERHQCRQQNHALRELSQHEHQREC